MEIDYSLIIIKVENGYVLKGNDNTFVIENKDLDDKETFTGRDLLFFVRDYFDLRGSKHDKYRLNVVIEGLEEENGYIQKNK